MEKEVNSFIKKVNSRNGYIDYIDAFRLVHIYTNMYGVLWTTLSIEDELILMWDRINKPITKSKKVITEKVCYKCKVKKEIAYFSIDRRRKDGLDGKCMACKNEYGRRYRNGKK